MCLFHHPDYPRERRVRSHALGAEGERAPAVDRSAEDLVPDRLFHGHALAREHALVHLAAALEHHAVAAKALARAHEDYVAFKNLFRGYLLSLPASHHHRRLGRERGERGDRAARAFERAMFEIFAQRDERDDHGHRLEIERMPQALDAHAYAHIVIKTVSKSRRSGDGDEAVHIGFEPEKIFEAAQIIAEIERGHGQA